VDVLSAELAGILSVRVVDGGGMLIAPPLAGLYLKNEEG